MSAFSNPDAALVASWTVPVWPTLLLLLTALIYLRGWRLATQTRPEQLPPWRAGCFLGGLATAWLAIASPLDALGSLLLSAHMVQHFLLMMVVPPMVVLGAPIVPLLRGLPRAAIREFLGPLLAARPVQWLERLLTHPVFAWLAMNIAYLGWHVPRAYELALGSGTWHEVEHGCFLFTSVLFWWVVIQPWPSKGRWSRWMVLPYLVLADIVNTALSALLIFSGRVVYPTYAEAPRLFGISAMSDQAAAGAFMWVFGSMVFLAPALVVTMGLLSPRRRRPAAAAAHAREADAARRAGLVQIGAPGVAAQRIARGGLLPFDLLRAPAVGRILRSRYGRQSLQALSLLAAAAIIADGLLAHGMGAMGSMNLAGTVAWNVVRGVGVLVLLFAGNLFCMACPFTLPRELGRKLGLAKLRWPQKLRAKWLAGGLMLLFFWGYERFSLWNNPRATAWLLIAYFGTAFLVDTVFRGASFCRYVCPIGQFNFVGSMLSPTELQVKSMSTCASCATRDCIRGNTAQRGCEYDLYLPRKVGNLNCTLCMDCVKACPHDNIALAARPVTRDILNERLRSSIRRLSTRVDLASIALVLFFSAFANAAAMVGSGAGALAWLGARVPLLSSDGGSLAGVLVLAAVVLFGAWAVAALMRFLGGLRGTREVFCRFCFALAPLGMGMWAAHLLFHLVTGIPTVWPVLQGAANDVGLRVLGTPQWVPTSHAAVSSVLPWQLTFLDAGLLLSLYLGWRTIREQRSRRAWAALVPWVLGVTAMFALGMWLLGEPMQMRGVITMGGM